MGKLSFFPLTRRAWQRQPGVARHDEDVGHGGPDAEQVGSLPGGDVAG